MDDKKGKHFETRKHEEIHQPTNTKNLQIAASGRRLPPFEMKKYSVPTFQCPASSVLKIPQEQISKYKYPEIHKPFSLPSIQQSYQHPQQNTPLLSESSISSIESISNKQSVSILPSDSCGANFPSVWNKSIKRPISKSNSSESSSDRSANDINNRNIEVASLPVEVTVSSRVEVKTRLPDNLPISPVKNG